MNSDEVKKEREAFTDEEDTTYDLLLKQQQLYLQWQLENQNKVSQCQNYFKFWPKIYIDESKLCIVFLTLNVKNHLIHSCGQLHRYLH